MRGDLFALQGDMEFLAANVARLRTGLFVMTLHTVMGTTALVLLGIWAFFHPGETTMPDDDRRFSAPHPAPERIDLAAIKADLEFTIGQLSRLHKQLARTALGIIFCTATATTFLNWWLLSR